MFAQILYLFQCNINSECEFRYDYMKNNYNSIESISYPKRFLAVSSTGTFKRAKKVKKRLGIQHSFLHIKIPDEKAGKALREYYNMNKVAGLQHCANYDNGYIPKVPGEETNIVNLDSSRANRPHHRAQKPSQPRYQSNSYHSNSVLATNRNNGNPTILRKPPINTLVPSTAAPAIRTNRPAVTATPTATRLPTKRRRRCRIVDGKKRCVKSRCKAEKCKEKRKRRRKGRRRLNCRNITQRHKRRRCSRYNSKIRARNFTNSVNDDNNNDNTINVPTTTMIPEVSYNSRYNSYPNINSNYGRAHMRTVDRHIQNITQRTLPNKWRHGQAARNPNNIKRIHSSKYDLLNNSRNMSSHYSNPTYPPSKPPISRLPFPRTPSRSSPRHRSPMVPARSDRRPARTSMAPPRSVGRTRHHHRRYGHLRRPRGRNLQQRPALGQ